MYAGKILIFRFSLILLLFFPLCEPKLEQDNQTISSLVDFLTRLVELAVTPPPPHPETSASVGNKTRRTSEGGAAAHAPALSLDMIQWEQLRVDQSLLAFIAMSAAKTLQIEKSAADSAALHRSAIAKCDELNEECSHLRVHGTRASNCADLRAQNKR
jgi:hypothetical protein